MNDPLDIKKEIADIAVSSYKRGKKESLETFQETLIHMRKIGCPDLSWDQLLDLIERCKST